MPYNNTMWLHEAVEKGRKRGYFQCKGCDVTFSMSDGDMPINHVKNNECGKCISQLKAFGIDARKTESYKKMAKNKRWDL